MVTGFNPTVPIIAGLLDSIVEEMGAKDRREHGSGLLRDDETLNALKTVNSRRSYVIFMMIMFNLATNWGKLGINLDRGRLIFPLFFSGFKTHKKGICDHIF